MMRSFVFSAMLLLAAAVPASARLTADRLLAEAPRSVIPLLDTSTRLDMLDYFRSGMKHPLPNALGGESEVTELTDDAVTVAVTEASSCRMVLLPAGADTIVMVIDTYATPGRDSRLAFYDRTWRRLDGRRLFKEPALDDWCVSKQVREAAREKVPYVLAGYDYDTAARRLTLTNNTESVLPSEEADAVVRLLRPELEYNWNGKRFVRVKDK